MWQAAELFRHGRGQRVVENREVTVSRGLLSKRPHIISQVIIHGHCKELGLMSRLTKQIADAPGAVPNRIPPMRRRDPLVDDQTSPTVFVTVPPPKGFTQRPLR